MAVIQYESDVSVRGRVLIDGGLPYQFLKADGSLDSNTYALASSVHNPVTIGTANGLSLSNQQLSLGLASSGTTGALSGTDWNTFNNKQPAITGLTTNYLPKWNGSGFGNSQIVDNGSKVRSDLGFVASSSDPNNVLKSVRFTGNGGLSVADTCGEISLGTSDASTEYVGARIVLQASETWSPNSARGSNLLFQNCQNGSTVLSERMRISDMGNVGINQPNPTEKLDVVGNIKASGTISASPATTANQVVVMSQINGKANADGSNASGTWGISINGNASSATNWGGRTADLNTIDNNVGHLLQRGNDGVTRLAEASGVRTWLGLGSNAYTSTPYLPLTGGSLTGNLVVASTAASSLNLGSVSSSWNGDISYPTIFGSTPDRWVMHINPHISYTAPGVNGFSGTMTGSTIRFAGNPATATYWDIGVGTNGIGEDKFSIGRAGTNFLNITNSGTVQVSNIFDVMGASYLYGGLTVSGSPVARTGYLAVASAIAIGDSDTGFRQNGDGVLETYANGALVRTDTSQSSTFSVPIVGTLNGSAAYLQTIYNGGDSPNPQSYFNEGIGLRVAMTRSAWLGAWSDTLWINGYSGGDVPNMVAVHTIRNGQPRMWLSSQSNRATDYGTPYEVITDFNAASKVLRKGNDTNGGTYQLYSTNTGGGYNTRAIELRETNLAGATVISPEYAPAIGFHWSNLNQTKLMMRNDGQLAVSQNAADWGNALIHSGNIGQQSVSFAQSANSANTVGGISTDRIVYGGVRASNNDNNLNNPNQKSGFYYTYGGVGAPTADWGNWITVAGSDWTTSNNYEFQLWHAFHSDDFYVRKMANGSPDSWRRVIDSGNIGSQSVNYATTAGNANYASSAGSANANDVYAWAKSSTKPAYNHTEIGNATLEGLNAGEVRRKVFLQNVKLGNGYVSRVALGLANPLSQFSPAILSVGTNDAGDSWMDYTFGANGIFISPVAINSPAFYQTSDIRLKNIIEPTYSTPSDIELISYTWKDTDKDQIPQVGYSAQEVQKVMPNAVSVADDGMLSVNYIQVLVAKVAELELKLKKHGLE